MKNERTSSTAPLLLGMAAGAALGAAGVMATNTSQLVQQADALGGIVAEHLADHIRTVHAILIADVGAGQIAIAFLKAEHIAVGPALLFQLADEFHLFRHNIHCHNLMMLAQQRCNGKSNVAP